MGTAMDESEFSFSVPPMRATVASVLERTNECRKAGDILGDGYFNFQDTREAIVNATEIKDYPGLELLQITLDRDFASLMRQAKTLEPTAPQYHRIRNRARDLDTLTEACKGILGVMQARAARASVNSEQAQDSWSLSLLRPIAHAVEAITGAAPAAPDTAEQPVSRPSRKPR